jgi:hypothetical protein
MKLFLDTNVYIYGETDSFVSSNRELIRQIADFECLTSENFIQKYLC